MFSDIIMPGGMTGYDVAEWVRSVKPELKVLLTPATAMCRLRRAKPCVRSKCSASPTRGNNSLAHSAKHSSNDGRGLLLSVDVLVEKEARMSEKPSGENIQMPLSNTEDQREAASSLKGVHVLVVEDAWHLAKALKSALTEVGIDVARPAATIAEAERLVAEHRPDVAVVDVNLNGEMAYDLIDWLHDRGVRVIVVSGYAVLQRSTDKAAAVLQKPFSVALLLATLRRVLQ